MTIFHQKSNQNLSKLKNKTNSEKCQVIYFVSSSPLLFFLLNNLFKPFLYRTVMFCIVHLPAGASPWLVLPASYNDIPDACNYPLIIHMLVASF